ncbi:hypothetical protein MWN33_02200 [Starkeya koreensis]|uniref:Alpha/beta hydrolase n=1 Tax=Ancylobacter koreensis TaxID=266121 RepID=A0ABT0DHT0_9HYPH|nr:hypothetical protein [Ancylobacter koreensis]MCK0206838.1 hypothetical protein [Ancylobacter koreensis]
MDSEEPFRHLAAAFARAVQHGGRPTPQKGNIFQHLSVLNQLARSHPLEAARLYAASAEIPWGRFASLDALRQVIVQAPSSGDDAVDGFPPLRPDIDYVTLPYPGARKVLFVFTGAAHQFGAPLRVMHQWFRRLGVSLVYVFDMDWNYYLGTVRGLGGSVGETAAALAAIRDELGATSCYCAGNSGGGFGALLYAPRLGARRSLAFSPPTAIRESLESVRRKGARLDGLVSPRGEVELRAFYLDAAEAPPARVHFAANNAHDRDEAENLAGLPGIELLPLPDTNHNLIPSFIARGLFMPALEWLVAD